MYKLEEQWDWVFLIPSNELQNGKLSSCVHWEFVDNQKIGIEPMF